MQLFKNKLFVIGALILVLSIIVSTAAYFFTKYYYKSIGTQSNNRTYSDTSNLDSLCALYPNIDLAFNIRNSLQR